MKNVLILGGGYGGLTVAQQLVNQPMPKGASITLVDRMPFQGLKTEYYALASGSVADLEVRAAFPNHPNINIKYGEIEKIDLINERVHLANQDPLPYDILVIALGCVDNYHGVPGAAEYTKSIQTLSATRKTYLTLNDIRPYGHVSIVGGGLSGVELASELRECRRDLNIQIFDRGKSVLASFPNKLQRYVREWFEENDVDIQACASVDRVEPHIIHNNGQEFHTDCVVWTAGIQPSPIVQNLDLPKDSRGRVLLNEYHQVPAYNNVYVIGDCASLPFPPSAQLAESQGKQAAEVIQSIWKNQPIRLGTIKLKGVLGSLGKKSGFGVMGKRAVSGRVPRIVKSGVLWMSKNHFG